ncbi:hypothetical protein AK812_SmicGene42633 [Symbiodinium microadriaticum]|uniref:Uncharacterized protein n=1 Tax=Symbiodinium microadriaticum TaxID=2951 RepID=A0A1Q9C337_SYMMI|nr:hypothetical protein AK812_SmicGene42633 [Symbiodinium microadriaticum]
MMSAMNLLNKLIFEQRQKGAALRQYIPDNRAAFKNLPETWFHDETLEQFRPVDAAIATGFRRPGSFLEARAEWIGIDLPCEEDPVIFEPVDGGRNRVRIVEHSE